MLGDSPFFTSEPSCNQVLGLRVSPSWPALGLPVYSAVGGGQLLPAAGLGAAVFQPGGSEPCWPPWLPREGAASERQACGGVGGLWQCSKRTAVKHEN